MSTNIDINKFKRLSRFTPLVWRDNVTKLNASNMNTISNHLQALNDALSDGDISSAISEIQNSTLVFKASDSNVGYTYNPSAGAPMTITLHSLGFKHGETTDYYKPLNTSTVLEVHNLTVSRDNTSSVTYNPLNQDASLNFSSLELNGNTYNPLASTKTQLYIPKLNVTRGSTTNEYTLINTSEAEAIDITIPEKLPTTGTLTILQNDTALLSGYDGSESKTVNINVPSPTFSLKTNNVTTEYTAGTDNSIIKLKAIKFGNTTSTLLSETGEDSLDITLGKLEINGVTYDGTSDVSITVSGGGEGGTITVDSELSLESANAVQNKVITAALNGKVTSGDVTDIAYYGNDLQTKSINNVGDIFNYTVGKKCYKDTAGTVLGGESFNSAKTAWGTDSHAEGYLCLTDTSASWSHAQGYQTRARGQASFTSGRGSFAIGHHSSCIGWSATDGHMLSHLASSIVSYYLNNKAHISKGVSSFNTGENNITWGARSFTMGQGNIAVSDDCLVHGRFSDPKATMDATAGTISQDKKYLHIVGNGTKVDTEIHRSNAYTLDEEGNGVFSGTVSYTDSITDPTTPTQKTLTSSITLQIEYLDNTSQDIEIPVISITQGV